MKLLHLADLHLGKKVNEFSMMEDQRYILLKILQAADSEKPDGVLIAGDVYDKAFPSVEAVELLNDFLSALAERNIPTFIISGNHDSAERLAFASELIDRTGIHIARAYNGSTARYELTDAYGSVNIYLLPFIKPVQARQAFPDQEIASYNDAVAAAVENMPIDSSARNVLVTHQFVTGAVTCESEEISVGGTDNISVSLFDSFDYVALGHIHSPQHITRETVRYAGSPLKYSFSETRHQKSITVVELQDKGSVTVREIPLIPKYDMAEIKGFYNDLMSKSFYETQNPDDYYHITLTDEEDIPDAISKLRTVYRKIMKLDYDNTRTRSSTSAMTGGNAENKSAMELVAELYEKQNGKPMDATQKDYVLSLIEKIWEEMA